MKREKGVVMIITDATYEKAEKEINSMSIDDLVLYIDRSDFYLNDLKNNDKNLLKDSVIELLYEDEETTLEFISGFIPMKEIFVIDNRGTEYNYGEYVDNQKNNDRDSNYINHYVDYVTYGLEEEDLD